MGLRRWIKNWLMDGEVEVKSQYPNLELKSTSFVGGPQKIENPKSIRLSIHYASGGRIVETNRYDHSTDRMYNELYVITSDQDFGKELDKILTMENLRR